MVTITHFFVFRIQKNSKMYCFHVSKLLFVLGHILHIIHFQHLLVNTKKFNSMLNVFFWYRLNGLDSVAFSKNGRKTMGRGSPYFQHR